MSYPAWICGFCGTTYGKPPKEPHCATYHEPDANDPHDKCGWCGTQKYALTEPRDWSYPRWPVQRRA